MTIEKLEKAEKINKDIKSLKKRYSDLEYLDHYSMPYEFIISKVKSFFRRKIMFHDRDAIHNVSSKEAILLIDYLQKYRLEQIKNLEKEIEEI